MAKMHSHYFRTGPVACGGHHSTNNCPVNEEDSKLRKCGNCGGNHIANYGAAHSTKSHWTKLSYMLYDHQWSLLSQCPSIHNNEDQPYIVTRFSLLLKSLDQWLPAQKARTNQIYSTKLNIENTLKQFTEFKMSKCSIRKTTSWLQKTC